jgi:hypothetical protein
MVRGPSCPQNFDSILKMIMTKLNQIVLSCIISTWLLLSASCTYYNDRSLAGDCFNKMMNNFKKDPQAARQIDLMLSEIFGKRTSKLDLCSQNIGHIEGDINFDVLPNGQIDNVIMNNDIDKIELLTKYISSELLGRKIIRGTKDTLHICRMFSYNKNDCLEEGH